MVRKPLISLELRLLVKYTIFMSSSNTLNKVSVSRDKDKKNIYWLVDKMLESGACGGQALHPLRSSGLGSAIPLTVQKWGGAEEQHAVVSWLRCNESSSFLFLCHVLLNMMGCVPCNSEPRQTLPSLNCTLSGVWSQQQQSNHYNLLLKKSLLGLWDRSASKALATKADK